MCWNYVSDYFFSAEVSLIKRTDTAPNMSNPPASTSIFTCEPPTRLSKRPPTDAATIWGKQIVPLNKPRYVPIFLPEIELVKIVKGNANIAAQAQPMSKYETNNMYWSVMNIVEIKPMPPSTRLMI